MMMRGPSAFVSAALIALCLLATPVSAVQRDELLKDTVQESRARAISEELRCMVCQNQSIDDSDAPLARDLRLLVRERIVAGDSDSAIRDFIVARYGDFILLKPPLNRSTWLLWFSPLLVLLGGVVAMMLMQRRRQSVDAPAPLSVEERARIETITAQAQDDLSKT